MWFEFKFWDGFLGNFILDGKVYLYISWKFSVEKLVASFAFKNGWMLFLTDFWAKVVIKIAI